ncbi:methyltransferase domain-containing protein [bacterium]|nr:methyltransferase domain-containing protein [bacterium]
MSEEYILENENESRRLAEKVDAAAWVARYCPKQLPKAGKFLDVGCGPGVIAAEIANHFAEADVFGVDIESTRFTYLGSRCPSNLSLIQGDVNQLPFDDCGFDYVQCRFLLEYLRSPERALAEMFRVLKPGGRLLLQDLDGQLLWHYPEDPVVTRVLGVVLSSLSRTGFDPLVGRKLYTLTKLAGFLDVGVEVEPYHLFPGSVDDRTLSLWNMKLSHALPVMAKAMNCERQAEDAKEHFLNYLRREDRFTYSVMMTVVARRDYGKLADEVSM